MTAPRRPVQIDGSTRLVPTGAGWAVEESDGRRVRRARDVYPEQAAAFKAILSGAVRWGPWEQQQRRGS